MRVILPEGSRGTCFNGLAWGFYCHDKAEYLISHYFAVHTGCDFALIFFIPFGLIVHNYVRISIALFRSFRERGRLKEGTDIQWVTLKFSRFTIEVELTELIKLELEFQTGNSQGNTLYCHCA